MIIKIKYMLLIALAALVSCSSDEFVGDTGSPNGEVGSGNAAISFGFDVPQVTRASGAAAAGLLANNFVVFGYKTVSSSPQTVFDNYQVNYVTNTARTTESNSANWEYVGYKNLPNGVSTNVGVSAFSALTGSEQANEDAVDQTIKYWDFSATQYDFFAYSLGVGNDHDSNAETAPQYARASALSNSTYSLEGSAAELGTCYISNKKTLTSLSTSATEVDLEFLSFLSKVELKFYEIIPGYSVKTVKFYSSSSGAPTTTPSLFAGSSVIPFGGKYTITFDGNGKAQVALGASDPAPTTDTKIDFSTTLTNLKDKEYKETSEVVYLGRASNDATSTNTITVLPNPDNTNALNLKMDFTLVSRDGTGETINMTGATAVIPAVYAKWKPNYKYTYIFKISDNTNAQSGAVTGLYPITLDAVVTDNQDGTQETITTVAEPSITTYAKASDVLTDNEYKTGANIYVVVDMSGSVQALTVGTNANLYLVTNDTGSGSTQEITEQSVDNALAHGTATDTDGEHGNDTWTVTGAGMKSLIVTTIGVPTLNAITSIAAGDSPSGVAINVNGAEFQPTDAGTYAFEFISRDKATGTYVGGTTYYTAAVGDTTVDTTGFEEGVTDVSSYYVGDPKKYYKVIKVVAPAPGP